MNEKDKNFAILCKLYELADEIWANAEYKQAGVFTAADIARSFKMKNEKIVSFGDSEIEQITVEVDSFSCTIPKIRIFEYISIFERLAGVGSKKAKVFVYEEEKGNVLGSCKFELTKDFADLVHFIAKDELRQTMLNVALNVDLSCLVASDGHVLKAYPVHIIETSGDMSDFQIQGAMFSKLCKRLGARETYIAECTNYGESGCIQNCVFSCDGLSITTGYSGRYPNVKGVMWDVREAGRMILCPGAWKDASKFLKSSKGQTVKITANVGEDFAVLSNEVGGECVIKTLQNPVQNVESIHDADSLRLFGNVREIFFAGPKIHLTIISDDASFGLAMPSMASQPYDLGESEQYNPIELAKAARNDKKAAKVSSCRPAKEKARKTPPTASCGNNTEGATSRKRFSFEAVGVNVGDKLSFIDGTEVVAVAGNKVEFCGEVFTLSGFCKEFMPDEKRTKSNSYRGCNFFFLDGVCLGKLFRDVMEEAAAQEVVPTIDEGDEATFEPQRADGIPEKGHISHEANNFECKESEEKPNKGQTGRSDGKTTLHPIVVPIIARKRNTGRFWPLFGRVGEMEATAARRVRAKVLRRRAPTFVAGRVRPPPYYAHNEGWMNSFRFYNNFKITKQ